MKFKNQFRPICSGLLSVLIVSLCSCASGPKPVSLDSAYIDQQINQNKPLTQIVQSEQNQNKRVPATSGGDSQLSVNEIIPGSELSELNPLAFNQLNESSEPSSPAEEVIPLPIPEEETASEIKLVDAQISIQDKPVIQQTAARRSIPIFKTVATAPIPRKPMKNVSSSSHESLTPVLESQWEDYRDEHLIDGGDRAHPIHLDPHGYAGLDTEDTFVEYADHTGVVHVKPSNEVMIYSPRFAAVRTIYQPLQGVEIAKLAGSHRAEQTGGMKERLSTTYHGQRVGTDRIRVRSRLSGLDTDTSLSGLSERTVLTEHNKILNTYIDEAVTYFGGFEQKNKAEIASGVTAAITWTRDENPVITASTAGAMDIKASFIASEIVGLEDQKTKGRLKIIKLADKKTALKDEIVKFTIKFSNLGDRELKNIRIVDNLTPRLEYIAESATSELEGQLDVYDNGEGSLVLAFEISEELKGHKTATVTFDCKVK